MLWFKTPRSRRLRSLGTSVFLTAPSDSSHIIMLVHLVLSLSVASGTFAASFLGQREEQPLAAYDYVIAGGGTAVSLLLAIYILISLDLDSSGSC